MEHRKQRFCAMACGLVLPALFVMFNSECFSQGTSVRMVGAEFCADPEEPSELLTEAASLKLLNYGYERGGHFFVYLKNESASPVGIKDILLNNASLAQELKTIESIIDKTVAYPDWYSHIYSIYLGKPSAERWALIEAGEPIWYRLTPNPIPPGSVGSIIVRTRTIPEGPVDISVVLSGGSTLLAKVRPSQESKMWLAYVGFNPKMDVLYIYVEKKPKEKLTVDRIVMDGVDVTSYSDLKAPGFFANLSPVILSLKKPLKYGSYHLLEVKAREGVGVKTTAMVRAWDNFFPVGMFAYGTKGETGRENVLNYYYDIRKNHFNTTFWSGHFPFHRFQFSPAGIKVMKKAGLKWVPGFGPGSLNFWLDIFPFSPNVILACYLQDEPDVSDGASPLEKEAFIPPNKRLGMWAMWNVKLAEVVAQRNPELLTVLMIDNTYSPSNHLVYGRLGDIPAVDVYLQGDQNVPRRIKGVYLKNLLMTAASRPKPLHVTLDCTKRDRYSYPEEERITVYYALAAGAKGISFWWYPTGDGSGLENNPKLLADIGDINPEVQSASSLLSIANPVDLPVSYECSPSSPIWGRTLLAADKALVLVLINDTYNYTSDGFTYTPLKEVKATLPVPSWLKPVECFSIETSGVKPLSFEFAGSDKVKISVGDLLLTKLIVVSNSKELSSQMEAIYKGIIDKDKKDSLFLEEALSQAKKERKDIETGMLKEGFVMKSGFEPETESDWFANWWIAGKGNQEIDSSEKRSGEYSLKCSGIPGDGAVSNRRWDAVSGKHYRLTFYCKFARIEREETVRGEIYFYDKEYKAITSYSSNLEEAKADGWQEVTVTGAAPERSAFLSANLFKMGGSGVLWIDDVSMEVLE